MIKYIRKISCSILFLSLFTPLSAKENNETRISTAELPKFFPITLPVVDTLSFKLGYSRAFYSKTIDNGGVTNVVNPKTNGFATAFCITFNNGQEPLFEPYVDFSSYIFSDRNFYIPTIGLKHEFNLDNKALKPYAAIGVGYAVMDRKSSPLTSSEAIDERTASANLSLEAGIDYYITKHWALDFSARLNSYNIETVVGGYYKLTTLEDRYSLNLLAGIVYRFGAIKNIDGDDDNDGVINSQDYCLNTPVDASVDTFGCAKDDDSDGVIDLYDQCKDTIAGAPVDAVGCATDNDQDGIITLYDRCPNTLKGAPVTACGCVPYKFDFALTYDYNKYKIKDMLQQPSFNVIDFLKQYKNYKVKITGYADTQGSAKNNAIISKRRAFTVRDYLIKHGIDKSKIKVLYRGDKELDFDNKSADNMAKNRHILVEFYRNDTPKVILKERK
jgi:opacity protein-like surface antigen